LCRSVEEPAGQGERIKGAGWRPPSGRHAMAGTNEFSIGNLLSDPKFNFINNISAKSKDDIYGNHLSFLDAEDLDFPYNSNSFSCNYIDVDQLPEYICPINNIVIMSINVQSLASKFDELYDFLQLCSQKNTLPDIILLQETWSIVDGNLFNIKGYHPLILKCRSRGQGGGVGIFVKEGIKFKINTHSVFLERIFESLLIGIEIGKSKFTVGSLYRCISKHRDMGAKEQFTIFNDLLQNLLNEITGELVLGGDLNLDVLKIQNDLNVNQYVDTLFTSGCLQIVTRPTCCTTTSVSCLDHFITNVKQSKFNTSVLVSKISDHFPIFFSIQTSRPVAKHSSFTCRDFSNHNINSFCNQLLISDWSGTLEAEDADTAYNSFSEIYNSHHNTYFKPRVQRFNKNKHKRERWMTTGLLTSRLKKKTCQNLLYFPLPTS
jgi:Endonuclease/Exonuclease/phosphatase family